MVENANKIIDSLFHFVNYRVFIRSGLHRDHGDYIGEDSGRLGEVKSDERGKQFQNKQRFNLHTV